MGRRRTGEREFQQQVVSLAKLTGWKVAAFRPALTRGGRWVTPMQGDVGYPDLTMAKPGRGVLFVELKLDDTQPTPEQVAWLECLRLAGAQAFIWRPRDWGTIEEILGVQSARRG